VDVGEVADIEVQTASIFRVKVCEEGEFLCVYCFEKQRGSGGRMEIGASSSQTSLTSTRCNNPRMDLSSKSFCMNVDEKHQIHNGKRFSV
jgi:hypothetical protein